MDIILQRRGNQQPTDVILQHSKKVNAGEIVETSSIVGHLILIGAADPQREDFEEVLLRGLKAALEVVVARDFKMISIDVSSFVSEPTTASYILNVFLDGLIEWRVSASVCDRKIYLLYTVYPTDGSIVQDLEDVICAPIKVYANLSFGDQGDPLKKEFQGFLQDLSNQKPFRKYLLDLIDEKGFPKYSAVYKKCGISKSTFSKIANYALPDYKPSKSTVAAFAIGLELDLPEAQKLFHAAGYHLNKTEKMDQIVRFFIGKKIYDIQEINYCMDYFGLPLLGEHSRDDCVREEKDEV